MYINGEIVMSVLHPLSVNLKKLRKQNNMTQAMLAEKIDVTTAFITDIEIQKKYPSLRNLEKIADVFGVEPFELIMPEQQALSLEDKKYISMKYASRIRELADEIENELSDLDN